MYPNFFRNRIIAYLFLLHLLLHRDSLLLVLASLVLKPYPDDTWTESRHLDELFLHECVGSWIRRVTSPECMQLLLVQNCAYPRWFTVGTTTTLVTTWTTGTANSFVGTALWSRICGIVKHIHHFFCSASSFNEYDTKTKTWRQTRNVTFSFQNFVHSFLKFYKYCESLLSVISCRFNVR